MFSSVERPWTGQTCLLDWSFLLPSEQTPVNLRSIPLAGLLLVALPSGHPSQAAYIAMTCAQLGRLGDALTRPMRTPHTRVIRSHCRIQSGSCPRPYPHKGMQHAAGNDSSTVHFSASSVRGVRNQEGGWRGRAAHLQGPTRRTTRLSRGAVRIVWRANGRPNSAAGPCAHAFLRPRHHATTWRLLPPFPSLALVRSCAIDLTHFLCLSTHR